MPRATPSPGLRRDFLEPGPPETSVAEPSWSPGHEHVYRDALDALLASRVPFVLGGAVALNAHTGVWRNTKDLDVFVPLEALDDLLAVFGDAGFATETVFPEWLARAYRGKVFVDVIHHGANALVPVTRDWIARAVEAPVLGRTVPVLSATDLVWSKVYVLGRNRCDTADIGHVLRCKAREIDWSVLVDAMGEDAELLLAHLHLFRWTYPSDARAVPDAVLAELRSRAAHPPGGFRGTLLDTVSYRVDVDAWGLPDLQAAAREGVLDRM